MIPLLVLNLINLPSFEENISSFTEPPKVPQPKSSELPLPRSIVVQDDIILPPRFRQSNYRAFFGNEPIQLWPGGIVNYIFKKGELTNEQQTLVRKALKNIERHSCVRFRETPSNGPYLIVRNVGVGCAAAIGYQSDIQSIDLYLSGDLCYTEGSIQHEFLHSLGLWHEHTRPDRDSFVSIIWRNIIPGAKPNFVKRASSRLITDLLPYDYRSVMHYGADAFRKNNNSLTIVPKQPEATKSIGQRHRFSDLDIEKLNLLYRCPQSQKWRRIIGQNKIINKIR